MGVQRNNHRPGEPPSRRETEHLLLIFATNALGHPVTGSGKRVTCDGCGIKLTAQPTAAQQTPVPAEIALKVYGQDVTQVPAGQEPLTYVVCERGVDCLTLAQLADECYARTACFCTAARPCTGRRP